MYNNKNKINKNKFLIEFLFSLSNIFILFYNNNFLYKTCNCNKYIFYILNDVFFINFINYFNNFNYLNNNYYTWIGINKYSLSFMLLFDYWDKNILYTTEQHIYNKFDYVNQKILRKQKNYNIIINKKIPVLKLKFNKLKVVELTKKNKKIILNNFFKTLEDVFPFIMIKYCKILLIKILFLNTCLLIYQQKPYLSSKINQSLDKYLDFILLNINKNNKLIQNTKIYDDIKKELINLNFRKYNEFDWFIYSCNFKNESKKFLLTLIKKDLNIFFNNKFFYRSSP